MIGQLFIGLAMATHQWQAYSDKQFGKWWYLMDEQGNEWWCDEIVGTPVELVCSRPGDWPQPAAQPRRAKRFQDPEVPGSGSKSTNAPKRLKQDEDNNTAGTTLQSSSFQATHLSQGPPIPQGASES